MDKKNVFVFPCGTEIGLEICRALKYNKHFELWGGNSDHNNHGSFVYPNYYDKELPLIHEKGFIEATNEAIELLGIDFLYPASDDALVKLALNRHGLACEVIASNNATVGICRSKRLTYERFKDLLPVPIIYPNLTTELELQTRPFPIFAKPDKGQGSAGAVIVKDFEQYSFLYRLDTIRNKDVLYMEYLPGEEYTIDCFTDRHGELRFVGARERSRIKNGISVRSKKSIASYFFKEWAKIINNNLNLRGAWFFQMKRAVNGELKLLEIEPRIAGTMGYYRVQGINFAALSLYDWMKQDIEIINNDLDMVSDRALQAKYKIDYDYDTVYVDFDDTLLIEGKLNPEIIAFMCQCLNNDKKIKLITRQEMWELYHLLYDNEILELFNDITFVPKGQNKSEHIYSKNAIFIDDSFAERKEVHDKLGIPVFDVDGVEALLE